MAEAKGVPLNTARTARTSEPMSAEQEVVALRREVSILENTIIEKCTELLPLRRVAHTLRAMRRDGSFNINEVNTVCRAMVYIVWWFSCSD